MKIEDLNAAVEAGILDKEQAERLRTFLAGRRSGSGSDEESLSFLRNFQDVFLTLGIALLTIGAGLWFQGWVGPMAAAVAAFGLALVLVPRRRSALPSLGLALAFTLATGFTFERLQSEGLLEFLPTPPLAALAASLLFFAVFRLPFALGLAAAAAALSVFSVTAADQALAAVLLSGLAVFALAMAFDMHDPGRNSSLSDIAFWLHLVAAPLIVHGVIQMSVDVGSGELAIGEALLILAVFVVMALVALVIDRRALLVSGLVYLGYAVAAVLREATGDAAGFAVVLLFLGAIVLVLALGWGQIRHFLLGRLPREGLLANLPPAGDPNA